MTKEQVIEQVYLKVSEGKLSPDNRIDRADIENFLPAAINYAITTYNRQERRDMMEEIRTLGYGATSINQQFLVTKTYTPALDTERNKYRITLDVKVQNLPGNKGLDDVFPVQGDSYVKAGSQREVQGLPGRYFWAEFPYIYFSDMGLPICAHKVRLVQSVGDMAMTDELNVPGDMEFQLVQLLVDFFTDREAEDQKPDTRADAKR
jgi:hypothetical protein